MSYFLGRHAINFQVDPVDSALLDLASRRASVQECQALAPQVPAGFDWKAWLVHAMMADSTVGAWNVISAVRPEASRENIAVFCAAIDSFMATIDSGAGSLWVLKDWPKDARPLPMSIRRHYQEALNVESPPPPAWHGLQMALRSGHNPGLNEKAHKALTKWTDASYMNVQRLMRDGNSTNISDLTRQQVASMRTYFSRVVALTPAGIPNGVRYLYRGIQGKAVEEMQAASRLVDRGFMAFSKDFEEARLFGVKFKPVLKMNGTHPVIAYNRTKPIGTQGCLIMRLDVRDIERGTPLVWFGHKHHPNSQMSWQAEVLFPPGVLSVIAGETDGHVLPVKYERDRAFLGR